MRFRRSFAAAIAGVALAVVLSGCGVFFPGPGSFDAVNLAAKQLKLVQVGHIEIQSRYGATGPDHVAYLLTVISGDDADRLLDKTLKLHGYVSQGSSDGSQETWRGPKSSGVLAIVRPVKKGDLVSDGEAKYPRAPQDGVALYLLG